MAGSHTSGWYLTGALAALALAFAAQAGPAASRAAAAAPAAAPAVTFTKDIAPILQRSCQNCHRPDQVAPMSLLTYEDARPWARAMSQRTGLRDKAGAMPPWYIEKNIGIQQFKHDPSLSDEEVAKIARWVDAGAPRGNAADMPPPLKWADDSVWSIGEPDLIVDSPEILVKANAPDWWGDARAGQDPARRGPLRRRRRDQGSQRHPAATTRVARPWAQRYVLPSPDLVDGGARGGRRAAGEPGLGRWPVHEVGRNADVFDPRRRPAAEGRTPASSSSRRTCTPTAATPSRGCASASSCTRRATSRTTASTLRALGNGLDIDIKPNEANQQLHAYLVLERPMKVVTFEPHLHAPGARMCLEYIWGINIQTLSCSGYDHNWVRQYEYEDDYAPLLPKGDDPPHHRLHGQHREEQEHPRPAQLAGLGQPLHRQHVHRPRARASASPKSSSRTRWPSGARSGR